MARYRATPDSRVARFSGAGPRNANGADLSLEESYALANAEGDDLLGLLVAANMLRAELAGNIVTYVVNRNMNFTNICFVGCKFCAFSRGPREADAYFHSLDDMARKAVEAWQLGATEVCIQGGLPRNLPMFYYRDILRAVKDAVPQMHIHAFSPMERCRARPPKSSMTKFATSSRRTSFRPRNGSRSFARRTAAGSAQLPP
jgi:2-iminoacetate synthase ThiH